MVELSSWTKAAGAGLGTDPAHRAVVPPIYLSSNYTFAAPDQPGAYDYSRSGNPTREVLNQALAELEGGAGCISLATGLAGVTLLIEALVPVGGRVLVQHDCYGGTWRLFSMLATQGRLVANIVNVLDQEAYTAALANQPALVWLETPSNPLLRITDIAAASRAAKAAGALTVVDNTFCSPLLQQPLKLGADFVLHSTTKFINGHSDLIGGAVISADVEHYEQLKFWANALGLTGGAFDAYLTLRGLRTLEARLRVHQENTAAIISAIQTHPAIAALHYPGLSTHPGHELAARQQTGFGSLFSLELAGGWPAVERFLAGLQIFHLAESLGGVESLICHPKTMTHAGMSAKAQAEAGITDGLLRVSVGLEAAADQVAVLLAALDRAN